MNSNKIIDKLSRSNKWTNITSELEGNNGHFNNEFTCFDIVILSFVNLCA